MFTAKITHTLRESLLKEEFEFPNVDEAMGGLIYWCAKNFFHWLGYKEIASLSTQILNLERNVYHVFGNYRIEQGTKTYANNNCKILIEIEWS